MRQVQHWVNHFAMAINEVFFNIYETNMQFAPQIDIDRAIKLVDWLKKFEGTILHINDSGYITARDQCAFQNHD